MTALVACIFALIVMALTLELSQERKRRIAAEDQVVRMALQDSARIEALYGRILVLRDEQALDLVRLATTGHVVTPEARVEEQEPTASERLSRSVTEQTIATGMARMREEYLRVGAQPPDEAELREEVEMILGGAMPTEGILRSTPLRVPPAAVE